MKLEEDKQEFFPQEIFMRRQIEKQMDPLKRQQENFLAKLKEERHLINKTILSDTFGKQSSQYDSWEIAEFYSGSAESPTEVRGNWMPVNLELSVNGLQLRSSILRSKSTITLQSLACELKISFRLVGDSTFWIVTRGSGVKDPDIAICKIKKEQDSQRVFLIFGANIGKQNNFKFLKKQEFPEISMKSDEVYNDFVDMKIKFIDNGDDRVFMKAILSKDKNIEMTCNKYIPCFKDTNIMLAGSGDSVLLKYISARQIERISEKPKERNECCNIF
ncbi:hypothetical protein SteCoe_16578 [Stentor coeruleus]|uniref:Uncharacterized protein n=1 Tax=Stentor coeruleus TaxID=5963 RepID=A0A1R2C0W8_9CILI|nr:hypothetical protein SteCoe_16578 [Stentor coeruleus]